MTLEELGSEPPVRNRPYGWLLAAVVGTAVVTWLVLGGGAEEPGVPGAAASPSASTSPSASRSPTPRQRPGIADARFIRGELCAPTTDHRRALTVSFTLLNPTAVDLVLVEVRPSLPLGGLVWKATTLTLGPCAAKDGEPGDLTSGRVPSGATALVTFSFRLPASCPQPFPVGAAVTSRVYNVSRSGSLYEIRLYPDLGSIDFDTCP